MAWKKKETDEQEPQPGAKLPLMESTVKVLSEKFKELDAEKETKR